MGLFWLKLFMLNCFFWKIVVCYKWTCLIFIAIIVCIAFLLFQLKLLEMLAPPTSKTLKGDISHLLVIDRSVDFAACLLSTLTYESLLDEVSAWAGSNQCSIAVINKAGQIDKQC